MGSHLIVSAEQKKLMSWYQVHQRALPWRTNRDPYRVWISEVMLQQTTVVAVVPYYEKFLKRFQTVHELAQADEAEVLKYWSGLGYYSRARNLHQAAQILAKQGFASSHQELLKIPGFGPYTSRAVSSICFDEKAGVLDGNVIRVLSRYLGLKWEWWKPQARKDLQLIADQNAQVQFPSIWNQAMMELGASLCTPKKPACLLCPLQSTCQAFAHQLTALLPLAKPRRKKEIWIWQAHLVQKERRILLVKNNYAPFLKNQWLPPGEVRRSEKAPTQFQFKHMITHHEIYVLPDKKKSLTNVIKTWPKDRQWVEWERVCEISPTSLVAKLLAASQSY